MQDCSLFNDKRTLWYMGNTQTRGKPVLEEVQRRCKNNATLDTLDPVQELLLQLLVAEGLAGYRHLSHQLF